MAWTKRQYIEQAFEEIGLSSYTFDIQADQYQTALRQLDSMMATWNGYGIRLSYPLPSSPATSNIAAVCNVPDYANEAVYLNLAVRMAPSFGKAAAVDTKVNAKAAYDLVLSRAAMPPEMQFPSTMPVGAGQKPWNIDQPFANPPVDPVLTGQEGPLEFY
jgi:hypothetical protein